MRYSRTTRRMRAVTALRRHYRQAEKGLPAVEVVPSFKPRERLATLDMACDAVLGACIGVNQLLEGTSQNDGLRALFERFERQGRRAAPLDPATPFDAAAMKWPPR